MKSITVSQKKHRFPLLLIPAGMAAGFLNGLLGAGAGIILIFVYTAFNTSSNNDEAERVKDGFAMTVATVIPISIFSLFSYITKVGADLSGSLVFLLPGAVGGLLGAYITDKIKTEYLRLIFAILTVIAGVNMIFR